MASTTTFRPLPPITHQRDVVGQPVTSLAFDPVSDALWTGSNTGMMYSYYGAAGLRGVSFPVGGTLAVRKILVGEDFVRAYSVDSNGLGSWSKGGMNKWYFRTSSAVSAFSNTSGTPNVLAVSTSDPIPELQFLSPITGSVVRRSPTSSLVTQLQATHGFFLAGSSDGQIRIYDPRTGLRKDEASQSFSRAHAGGIQDLQCSGNYAFTTGWGLRQSRPVIDPFIKVFDLRATQALPPIPFSTGPALISPMPRRGSSLVVASSQGLVNIVDATDPTANEFYQLDVASYITSIAVSPMGAYMGFGDADGSIHLMTAADENVTLPFNGFDGQPPEWADTSEPLPQIEWTDSTPLNTIGMPHYEKELLSSWTHTFVAPGINYPPPQKIPHQILSTMKMNNGLAYATFPPELRGRRNVVNTSTKDKAHFRSGRARSIPREQEVDIGGDIPRAYRRVEIEYSKFGVEDFDFGFYNKTEFSGLETHILNSYTNPLVQVLHYNPYLRHLAKSHITTNCLREHCLFCEFGFISRMLEDAEGTNCQASNFCQTVGVLAKEANAIDIIDYGLESKDMDYSRMIQSFHRFLVDNLAAEGDSQPYNPSLLPQSEPANTYSPSPITQLFGVNTKNTMTCASCKAVREKENLTHVIDILYPRKTSSAEQPARDFASILRSSITRELTHKAACHSCKRFASFVSRRTIAASDYPPILAFNAGVHNDDDLDIWLDDRARRFIKPEVELRGDSGDGEQESESVIYEVRALVVQITGKDRRSHLVAIIKVPEAENDPEQESSWYIFNDFVVQNVSEAEALSFPGRWKVPSIIYLERTDIRNKLDLSGLPQEIDQSILCLDTSITVNRDESLIKHQCLRPDELPTPGTMIAIDAEFVSMQQEEIEYRSDGSHKVLRPARLSLARVSVLRGDGPQEGVPFIDDHIHTSDVVVDYLTEYSGIKMGDLDPHHSRYTLTPLKLVYKKLRLLVDRGCIFIGHGLSKDFRIINLYVPPDQVIDTVDLYFLKARQRRLSLRFLSWFVLQENIQTGMHDSIEDARSALLLYKAYQAFEAQGAFDQKLEELYKLGRENNWRPPPLPGAPAASPSQVPATANTPAPYFFSPRDGSIQASLAALATMNYPMVPPPPPPASHAHMFSSQSSGFHSANWRTGPRR